MPVNIPHQQFIKELAKLGNLSEAQAKKLSGSAITGKFSYGIIKKPQAMKKHVVEFLDNAEQAGVKLPSSVTRQALEKHFQKIGAESAADSEAKPSSPASGFLGTVGAMFGFKPQVARKNFSAVEYLKKVHGQNGVPQGDKQQNKPTTSGSALSRQNQEPRAPDIG